MRPKDKLCIFLVRHGQTDYNVEGRIQGDLPVPLNVYGVKQANELAKKFKTMSITQVYASPLRRAKQTARIIAKPHKLKVKFERGISERFLGVLKGTTREERMKKYPHFIHERIRNTIDWKPPKGETIRHLIARAMESFKKIVRRHKLGDRIVIVSHGGTLRAIVHMLHNGKPTEYWHTSALDNAEIVEVHWDGKKAKIVSSYK